MAHINCLHRFVQQLVWGQNFSVLIQAKCSTQHQTRINTVKVFFYNFFSCFLNKRPRMRCASEDRPLFQAMLKNGSDDQRKFAPNQIANFFTHCIITSTGVNFSISLIYHCHKPTRKPSLGATHLSNPAMVIFGRQDRDDPSSSSSVFSKSNRALARLARLCSLIVHVKAFAVQTVHTGMVCAPIQILGLGMVVLENVGAVGLMCAVMSPFFDKGKIVTIGWVDNLSNLGHQVGLVLAPRGVEHILVHRRGHSNQCFH
ncbi:hypothetical protein BpHYR1_008822 [Brachionus plicatilis]|uniref:Uncharacterized protein n=1 Tax=Brachionus plicatilis TaxID=10195 RepID=A0A3M7R6Z5_BRAPC|nr:hypothetical protein BpHYR1_008822 [Brachionus plicatilis]